MKNKDKYVIVETKAWVEELADTKVIAITTSRDVAISLIEKYKKKHSDEYTKKYLEDFSETLSEEDYYCNVMEDLDLCFDFVDDTGYEYHLLASKPMEDIENE